MRYSVGLILTFHEGGRILGTAWILVGVVGFVALRRMKHMPVLTSETGKRILPGGYVMNAVVLVRTPADEQTWRQLSVRHSMLDSA